MASLRSLTQSTFQQTLIGRPSRLTDTNSTQEITAIGIIDQFVYIAKVDFLIEFLNWENPMTTIKMIAKATRKPYTKIYNEERRAEEDAEFLRCEGNNPKEGALTNYMA